MRFPNPIPTLAAAAWFATAFSASLAAQTPAPAPLEKLQRGLVALRPDAKSVFVSWRLLATDPEGTAFNLYRTRDGGCPTRLNPAPLSGPTFYTDENPGSGKLTYFVRPFWRGREFDPQPAFTLDADAPPRPYLEIPLQRPADGVTPSRDLFLQRQRRLRRRS